MLKEVLHQVKDIKKGSDGKWTVTTCVNGAGAPSLSS